MMRLTTYLMATNGLKGQEKTGAFSIGKLGCQAQGISLVAPCFSSSLFAALVVISYLTEVSSPQMMWVVCAKGMWVG